MRAMLPLVPGHEIVGHVVEAGPGAARFKPADRVGVPWLGWTCGICPYCRTGRENLCERARFTGYQIDGGYAGYTVADERYCFSLVRHLRRRRGGTTALRRADRLSQPAHGGRGAAPRPLRVRRGGAHRRPGGAPSGPRALVPAALRALAPGGVVVCGGIHMSNIPSFPYEWLWEERSIRSVANLTRCDGAEFLAFAPTVPVRTETRLYPLAQTNQALADLRAGALTGAAVLRPEAADHA